MTDTRPAGLGTGREYDFPEMRARFATPAPAVPELPTAPGLYAAYGDDWSAAVFALDESGYWWKLGHTDITADEVRAFVGTHKLEPLIRKSEADL